MNNDTYEGWLATRPKEIQEAFLQYPPMTCFEVKGRMAWLIGWSEVKDGPPQPLLSHTNPSEDYDKAREESFNICADHLPQAQ